MLKLLDLEIWYISLTQRQLRWAFTVCVGGCYACVWAYQSLEASRQFSPRFFHTMNTTMNLLFIVISIASIPFLLIIIRPYLLGIFFKRPRLEVELLPAEGSYSIQKWQINEGNRSEDPVYVYEACWCYTIVIRNVSKHDAHFPRLQSNIALPYSTRVSMLNPKMPIYAGSETTLNVTYKILNPSTERKRIIPQGIPKELKRVKLILEYTNEHPKKFYTVFDCKTNANSQHLFRPSGF